MGSGQSKIPAISQDVHTGSSKKTIQTHAFTNSSKFLAGLALDTANTHKSGMLAIKEEEKKMVSLFGKLYRFHESTGSLEDLGYDDTKNQITLIGGYQEEQEKSIMEVSLKEEEDIRSDSNDIRSESFEFTNPKVLVDMIRKIGHLDYEADKETPLVIQTLSDSYCWGSSSSIVMKNFDFASQHGVVSSRDSSAKNSKIGKNLAELKRGESFPQQTTLPRAQSYSLSGDLIRPSNLRIGLSRKNTLLDKVTESHLVNESQ